MPIARVIELLKKGHKPTKRQMALEGDNVYKLLREWDKLAPKDDVLYREGQLYGEKVTQLVLPLAYRDIALTGYHDDAGHQGRDRTAYLIKSRFYWPGMDRAIEQKVEYCLRCKCRKAATGSSAELVNIHTTQPMELVCMDYLSLEPQGRLHKHLGNYRPFHSIRAGLSNTQSNGENHSKATLWELYCILWFSCAIAQWSRQELRVRGYQGTVCHS